jgi:hypothetical protein
MSTPPIILEPLSTGDIIDRSVRIYRQNLRPLLGTVVGPFLVGAFGWLLVEFGKNGVFADDPSEAAPFRSLALLGAGILVTLLYAYLMVLAVAGLSRSVGDYVMLGEPVTIRASVRAVRSRLGSLTLASVFLFVALVVMSMITMMVLFVALMIAGAVGSLLTMLSFPPGFIAVAVVVIVLVALVGVAFGVAPFLIARVVFIPQAIMIEGCSASTALSRALTLGAKNWNRVLAILLFSYFTSFSLAAAVLAPIALLLWLTGNLSFDEDTINAVTGGINQFSSFLVVPVWSIAYTLLYFDNRVRKEGYDVDLLARRLPPPPAPRPVPAPAFVGAPGFVEPAFPRAKFAPDGRCLRCGRYKLFDSANCPGCGW